MTEELIAKKAEEFEFTNGTYAFKEAVKWTLKQIKNQPKGSGVSVDLNSCTASYKGKVIYLPKRMLSLLNYFILNKNRAIPREELLSTVWGDTIVSPGTVDVHIRGIKSLLGNDLCIKCVKRVGFKWML